jgi:hypothetical protein
MAESEASACGNAACGNVNASAMAPSNCKRFLFMRTNPPVPVHHQQGRGCSLCNKIRIYDPFSEPKLNVVSYNFAAAMEQQLRSIPWDLVVLDEQLFGDAVSFRSMFMRNGIRWHLQ